MRAYAYLLPIWSLVALWGDITASPHPLLIQITAWSGVMITLWSLGQRAFQLVTVSYMLALLLSRSSAAQALMVVIGVLIGFFIFRLWKETAAHEAG
jgi:hypothetical protein